MCLYRLMTIFFFPAKHEFHADMNMDSNEISNRKKRKEKLNPIEGNLVQYTQTYQFRLFTIDVSLAWTTSESFVGLIYPSQFCIAQNNFHYLVHHVPMTSLIYCFDLFAYFCTNRIFKIDPSRNNAILVFVYIFSWEIESRYFGVIGCIHFMEVKLRYITYVMHGHWAYAYSRK